MNYAEACKELEKFPNFKFKNSFAAVILPTKHTVECQTDVTWLTKDKPQLISNKNLASSKNKIQSTQTTTSQTQTGASEEPNLTMEHFLISKGKKPEQST